MSPLDRLRKLLGKTPRKPGKSAKAKSGKGYPTYRSIRPARPFRRMARRAVFYGGVALMLLIGWCYVTLPDINDLNKFTKTPSILIKSENGQIIGSFGDVYGDYLPFEELPQSLTDAVVATEDRNFYHHFGIDPYGLLRAAFTDLRSGHVVQGGSTITQQLAKNLFLTSERSLIRKIKEMMLAVKLEHRYSKQDIMSIYLNRVYFGAGTYGVDAAAHRYFDKSARDLSLSESAIMAGLLKAPSRFAPTSNPVLSRKRAEQVLLNMLDAGYLTKPEEERARAELVQSMSVRRRNAQSTFYFADWIVDQLPDYIGNVQQDLVVTTTLRPDWQLLAEKTVQEVMDKEGAPHNASQAALLAMTPDGAIRAMIGGRSYAESQYNRATQALRQPGSSFKLFVYLAGLEDGMTPNTMVNDHPISVPIWHGVWHPKNYTNKYLGEIPLREAVKESVNTVAVQVAERVGIGRVITMARRLGITSDLDPVPSIALGATEVSLLELTAAYAHMPAGGAIVYPYGILSIQTSRGDILYQRENTKVGQVLSPSIVGMMNQLLMGVIDSGTGKAARIGRPAAGKTGTTSDYKDAWFMGYTPQLAAGVWVGNDDNTPMKKVTGGMIPAQIWHGFMMAALAGTPAQNLPTGGGATLLPWQAETPAYPGQPSRFQHDESQPHNGSLKLDQGFWDKLFGR